MEDSVVVLEMIRGLILDPEQGVVSVVELGSCERLVMVCYQVVHFTLLHHAATHCTWEEKRG